MSKRLPKPPRATLAPLFIVAALLLIPSLDIPATDRQTAIDAVDTDASDAFLTFGHAIAHLCQHGPRLCGVLFCCSVPFQLIGLVAVRSIRVIMKALSLYSAEKTRAELLKSALRSREED